MRPKSGALQTVANKKHYGQRKLAEESGVQRAQEIQWSKSYSEMLKVWQELKISFEYNEICNDICACGTPLHELFNDIDLDLIARQNFLKFMLIYAIIF